MVHLTLLSVIAQIANAYLGEPQYLFTTVRQNERLCFSGHHANLQDNAEVTYSLLDEAGQLYGALTCKVVKNLYMPMGDFFPISMQERLPSMVDCELEFGLLTIGDSYMLVWNDDDTEYTSSNQIQIGSSLDSRTDGTNCFNPLESMDLDRQEAKRSYQSYQQSIGRTKRAASTAKPSITSVVPRDASPNGGVLITMFGANLRSTQLDISGVTDESEDQGENFIVWFEKELDGVTHSVPCDVDRMFGLHVKPLQGQDWLVCRTRVFPIWARWYLRVQIDGGEIIRSSGIDFYDSEGPTVNYFYPQASSPAKPTGSYDYAGAFYTQWFDTDDSTDGVEDESLHRHMAIDREIFQKCYNPLEIEVVVKSTNENFISSTNENADGYLITTYHNTLQGFMCADSEQTVDGISCPDVKVRYRCLPGLNEMQGRIYTQVHGRMDHPEFHTNRIMETPLLKNDEDGFKSVCQIFLNDGQNCGSHAGCGANKRLNLKLVSGNDGLIQYVANAPIPGAYNFTFTTFHNGNSVVDKRYLNYLSNEELFPTNYEVYPQILSVEPQMGSVNGGTLLTVKGTGFIEDGLGGAVEIKVGEMDCNVESMTETEIKCRTVGGPEETPTFAEAKIITMMDQRSTSHHQRNHWELGTGPNQVATADECIQMCKADATCLAFLFQEQDATWNGCWHIDYMGLNYTDAGQDEYMADANGVWHTWANVISGYVKMSDRQAETNCFTGRGELYQGTYAVTKYGKACEDGAFCRNDSPDSHVIPYCKDVEGDYADCNLIRCDETWGKYVGNRGVSVQYDPQASETHANLNRIDQARLVRNEWTNLDGKMSRGKYNGFYADNVADVYNMKARNYFVAPFDGDFTFQISGDDSHKLTGSFNADDGSFEELAGHTSWCSPSVYGCNYLTTISPRMTLAKGEKVQLQSTNYEYTGGDYIQLSVGIHGKDGSGTWIDNRQKAEMKQDSYMYDHQLLTAKADHEQDYIFLTLKFDADFQDNGVGLNDGEEFDSGKRAAFRIHWCGDGNNCFTSIDFNAQSSQIEAEIKTELKTWLKTECQQDGTFSPQLYHGTYETGADWPGHHHFRTSQGAWCGQYAHEVHNHDIWNTNLGSKFSTNTYNDICFAYKGNIEQLAIYGSFKYMSGDKKLTWTGWMVRDVAWSSTTWTHHCFQMTTEIILNGAYLSLTVEDDEIFDIKYIRVQNRLRSPIYIDELRIGKMRGSSFNMVQTKKALSFDGQVPLSFSIWRNHGSWGNTIRIHVNNWNDAITCGYIVTLPQILPPSGGNYDSSGSTAETTGADWSAAGFVEPWTNFIIDQLIAGTQKDYRHYTLNYYDSSDNKRSIYDAWVIRRSMSPEDMASEMVLTYGNDPTTLTFTFDYNTWPLDFTAALLETWPELEAFAIDTYRGGWCNVGYDWYVRSHQHGNMKTFTVTGSTTNRVNNPRWDARHFVESALVTQIMPGSVMATAHHLPQVVVTSNGQRSACDNCGFQYLESMTPEIVQVTTANGNVVTMGESISVQFNVKSYSGTLDNAVITIGDAPVTNCGAFSTSQNGDDTLVDVTCEVGSTGQGANHKLKLDIPELGTVESTDLYDVEAVITSHSPTTGSKAGGTIITVEGSGFAVGQIVSIDMGGSATNCDSTGLEVSYSTLVCRTQPNANIAGGVTPTISSSQSKFSVIGDEEFTITGSNLTPQSGCDDSALYIGAAMAEIISWSDSEIVAKSVPQEPSSLNIQVYVCNHGFSNAISGSVSLDITSVSASFSSMAGGRELVINGYGFQTDMNEADSVDVTVGTIPCDITALSNSQITCKTGAHNNRVHLKVAADGFKHYADNSPADSLEIEVGTEVLWTWMISIVGTVPIVRLQRVSASGDAETSNGQYWSEDISGNEGKFLKHFPGAGTYHYSTGFIDSQTIAATGTIKVVAAVDKPYPVNVQVNNIDANHVGSSSNAQPTGACNLVGASTANPPAGSGYHVTYSWATTPVVSKYQYNNPNIEGMIGNSPTLTAHVYFNAANSFDPSACSNDIMITVGEFSCVNTEANSGKQVCTVDPDDRLDTQSVHMINANLANMGDAYFYDYSFDTDTGDIKLDELRELTFAPHVSTASPQKFSRLGNVVITLTGHGFVSSDSQPTVVFKNDNQTFDCEVSSVSYTEIVCRMSRIASSLKTTDADLSGWVRFMENEYPIQTADFRTLESYTPTITGVSPIEVSTTGATLTISGARLDGLTATIGGQECTDMTVTGSSATCTIPDLSTGRHSISVKATYGGVVKSLLRISSNLAATSINPSSGGLNGGTLVTVTGFGFDENTVVEVYAASGERLCEFCHVLEIPSPTELVFYSPRVEAAQTTTVVIKHEYVPTDIPSMDFVYSDVSGTVSGGAVTGGTTDINAVVGGETLSISGSDFGACENLKVEIVRATDPCAEGMHECSFLAQCTPTADGMDYTCSCIEQAEEDCDASCQLFNNMGSGRECFKINRRGKSASPEEAVAMCEADNYGESIYEINNAYDEDNLHEILTGLEGTLGTHTRGIYVKWYGTVTCLHGMINDTTEEFGFAFPGECDSWGSESDNFEKRVFCRPYKHRNCYNHEVGDRGRYTYNGRKQTSMTGRQCVNWETSQWWDDYGQYHRDIHNNYCRSPWNGDDGLACPLGQLWDTPETTIREGCGIPKCSDIRQGIERQQCTINSFSTRPEGEYTWRFTNDTWSDDDICYVGHHNDMRLHYPERCYSTNRYPVEFRFVAVNEEENIYRIVRTKIHDDDIEYHLTIDPTNADNSRRVMFTDTEADTTSAKTEFYIDEDTFHAGTVTIRQGDYFVYAGSGNGGYMGVVHQNNLADVPDHRELSWVVSCTSDNGGFGALIDQPLAQFESVATISPQCGADITLELPSLEAGSYKAVIRSSEYGQAANVVDITYALTLESFVPSSVGTGGGTELVLSGTGYSDMVSATLCGEELTFVSSTPATSNGGTEEIRFLTVPFEAANCADGLVLSATDKSSGTVISTKDSRKRRDGSITVDESLTPQVTSVNPKKGGTMGGTTITIEGSGFGTTLSDVSVTIFEVACDVASVTNTEITCVTNAFPRGQAQVPVAPVVFIDNGPGTAINGADNTKDIEYWYVDRWSSPYTWGCVDESCKPKAGEIIVIPAGQVILLDESTPILAVLIIDGGTMLWDRKDGIELHMQYGIVNSGGHFEIGTEEEPFCSGKALITMYGHQRSINLPIYGAKVFAVRFGTIDIHGCPKHTTWTELDVTAEEGDDTIQLTHPVVDDWFVGDEIIIAATGDLTNFHRSEKRVIASVSADGYSVGLTEALEHRHMAVCSDGPNDNGLGWGWRGEVCTRAEVGLLTRNVKMMGNINNEWTEVLPECKLGVGTAFGTQTCFQNRFGHETGSDQFGSTLFLHKPVYAKIEFFEVTHAGQAFNLARYPIHFHTPGSMPDSYVRGCGIHNTFNRALTLHGVHDLLVEYNVIYNVMGLAFFMEDGVEENNILRYNLGIMNKKSSSLLNVDSTPAVFWITNPNNIFYGNRAAASSHFGFWFNPPEDGPTGPSAKDPQYSTICPKHRPLGQFYNNTAHSMGKYGLWIFVDLTPTGPNGDCGETEPRAAKFGHVPDFDIEGNAVPQNTFGFFAWHCERGAEIATGGALQFHNMIVANNWIAGLAGKETFLHTYANIDNEDQTQLFKRNIVIGHLGGDDELDACGDMGIETPWKFFAFTVDDIHFYNFDNPTPDKASVDISTFGMKGELAPRRCVAIDPCYGSNAFDCGAVTWYSNVRWHNSNRRTTFAWEHEAALYDKDGSLSGEGAGTYIVAESGTYNPRLCSKDSSKRYTIAGTEPGSSAESHGAMVCDEAKNGEQFKPHRFMFNNGKPDSVEGTMVKFENEFGISRSPFRNCRPRGKGWMVLLNGETEYSMEFEQHDHISNISFTGDIDDFEQDEWLTIRHDFPEKIDFAQLSDEQGSHVNTSIDSWPADPLTLNAYDYNIETGSAPYSVRYTFNGKAATENPQMSSNGGALTWGMAFNVHPQFHKCFYLGCVEPEPEPATPAPPLVDCNLLDCFEGVMPEDFAQIHVQASQKMIIDSAAVTAAGGVMKFSGVMVDGTLQIAGDAIAAGETLVIEADYLVVNTGAGDDVDALSRKRRDTMHVNNGGIVIGTAENPIPCDRKVIIKINGDKSARSFGALPGSIPIGAKAIGGIGGIQMHGCQLTRTWSTLTNTIMAGDNVITVDDDVSEWKVTDEIAVATSDFEQRHTEYFAITEINGQTLTLNTTAKWTHTGSSTSQMTILGRNTHQGAEVALLTRNIVIDGSGGAEGKVGGRVLITSYTSTEGGHQYVRNGFGQFSFVEFKGMGQFGYTNFDDLRSQILFYQVNIDGDAENGQLPSYVKGCAFHGGFHTAVAAMYDSNNLEISNNVIFGCVGSAIRTDSKGAQILNNVIGNVFQTQLWGEYIETVLNTNFADDKMPSGIDTSETDDADIVISGNRVAGVEGSCYAGPGTECDSAESCSDSTVASSWTDNKGHSCLRGYYVFRVGYSQCSKISGFTFYKMSLYGITTQSATMNLVIDDVIIEDSVVGIYTIMTGPNPVMHLYADKTVTIKNSYLSGKGDQFDCAYDAQWQRGMYAAGFVGRQVPPIRTGEHTAIVTGDFIDKDNGFPACEWWNHDTNIAIYGKTCVLNTEIANYNRKCGSEDIVVRANQKTFDHLFPITFVSGNSVSNVNADDIFHVYRPDVKSVNIADCSDLHCDAMKKVMVIDEDGGIFGEAGTMLPESEYEWDGITRVQPDGTSLEYSNTQDGLGDYRIPNPMQTNLDGSKIPMDQVFSEVGIVRNNNCVWKNSVPGWWCPKGSGADELRYFDLVFENMDADFERRRLTPLAVRSDGYIDIINGPGDHSCCIGYACQIRLMTIHTTIACGKSYDYFFSSTTPMSMKFHFPQGPEDCKIKLSLYTKKPNRIDLKMDDAFQIATNAAQSGENIEWAKPDNSIHIPEVGSHDAGSNFFQREAQLFHMILSGGHIYELNVIQTLVLELSVMTEMTEDEFYDNGNLANNIAALLGIDPSKIRVMNVIREDSAARRRRREAAGMLQFSIPGRFRRDADGTSLQIEITPDNDSASAQQALANVAETVIEKAAEVAESVAVSLGPDVVVAADIAVSQPPPQPPVPEEPVTLAALLGIEELTPMDDIEEFMKTVETALGQDLSNLKTAEETSSEAQAAVDAANEPIVYKTPTRLAIQSQPTSMQILAQPMFQQFVLEMYDQNDEIMENIGFVGNPWTVNVYMTDVTGSNSPAIDGTTTVSFLPADGRAVFDNLIVQGDVESSKFTFTISNPSDNTIVDVISDLVTFLPAQEGGECTEEEGLPFDRQESWTPECDFVCISPCADLGGLTETTGPVCSDVDTCDGGDGSTFAECSASGCGCNMTAVPPANEIDPVHYISATCDGTGLEMRINKCVLNRFGFMLKHLYIDGPEESEDFESLLTSPDNNCRGELQYNNGPEYVFRIDRTFSDCKTLVTNNGTHATYENAIQGSAGTNTGIISRQRNLFASFGCSFEIDLLVSVNLGAVGSQSMEISLNTVGGEFAVAMAVYEDPSYTIVAGADFAVTVPDHIHLGIMLTEGDKFILQAKQCWVTPDSDPNNSTQYMILENGCANADDADNINIYENGESSQARLSFAAFHFLGAAENSQLFMHCSMHVCDPSSTADCQADCSARRRRSTLDELNIVSLPIQLDMSVGEASCDADVDCVHCIPNYTGKTCGCPAEYTLNEDNSCTNMQTNHNIPTPTQMAAMRGKMSFHDRLQARLQG